MFRSLKLTILFCGLSIGGLAQAAFKHVYFIPPYPMPAQSIHVDLSERALYLYLGGTEALRYPVAVGKAGKSWTGASFIESKHLSPAWEPPPEVRAEVPHLRYVKEIPAGHPDNPMGAAALKLGHGDYAIHGTTERMRASIGKAASFGCIRMYNEDVLDLYSRVDEGTVVSVDR